MCDSDVEKLNPDSDSRKNLWIQIRIRIRPFGCRLKYNPVRFGFKFRRNTVDLDLAPNLFAPGIRIGINLPTVLLTLVVSDSNPDSDSKLLDSDSRKLRWIRIGVDSNSRQVDSDSRCPDSHITVVDP